MKPMLAARIKDFDKLKFPMIGSPKLDGVRAIVKGGVVYARSLKPIPNLHVQQILGRAAGGITEMFDGELILGNPTEKNVYNKTTSAVMTKDGQPDFTWFVFDSFKNPDNKFVDRYELVEQSLSDIPHIKIVEQVWLENFDELQGLEQRYLGLGYEGLVLRRPDGGYKFGRSTEKEGILLKLKRFEDSEAKIVGVQQLMHNNNTATIGELGQTKRSSHKANKEARELMGALHVVDCKSGVEFDIGTGFTEQDRVSLWSTRDAIIGKVVKYKFFPVGVKDKPRHPTFIGFRDPRDI